MGAGGGEEKVTLFKCWKNVENGCRGGGVKINELGGGGVKCDYKVCTSHMNRQELIIHDNNVGKWFIH
jgi:hypothetical protein